MPDQLTLIHRGCADGVFAVIRRLSISLGPTPSARLDVRLTLTSSADWPSQYEWLCEISTNTCCDLEIKAPNTRVQRSQLSPSSGGPGRVADPLSDPVGRCVHSVITALVTAASARPVALVQFGRR